MIEISIITIIILTVIAYIFFKLTKTVWKTILFTLIIILVFIGAIVYLVYQDVQEVINGENTLLVASEGKVITGATFQKDNINYFNEADLDPYSSHLLEEYYESILGNDTLLIILNTSMFNDLDTSVIIEEKTFSTQEGVSLITSNTVSEFLEKAKTIAYINETIITNEELIKYKLQITLLLVQGLIMEDQGAKTYIKYSKFYPERFTIKLIKQTPQLIEKLIPKN